MDIILLLLVAAIILVLIGVPVGFVLAITDILALQFSGIPLVTVVQVGFSALNNPLLLAIPFFIFTGSIMSRTGAAARLTDFLTILTRWMRGGLGMADIASSVLFADMSGSATSDTAAIGSVMIPALVRSGYRVEYATALQAAAGSLGVLFPPSLTTIIYAYVANVSIGQLFLATIAPGLLVAFSFMVINYIVARRAGYAKGSGASLGEVWVGFKKAVWVLVVPIIILGGIVKGVFTPTEAGTVAAVYLLVVSVVVYKELSWSDFFGALQDTVAITSRFGLLVTMAIVLGTILALNLIPQQVAGGLLGLTVDKLLVLLMINVILILAHTALETSSAILIIVPVLLPVISALHVSAIQFGVILLVNSAIGITLPPIGFCLYIACSVSNVPLERAAVAMLPFTGALLVDLAIVTIFPQVSLAFLH